VPLTKKNTALFQNIIARNHSDNSQLPIQTREKPNSSRQDPANELLNPVINKKWILSFVFFSLIIMLPRWYYVENFAVALPFWDQWDAEWVGLLKPWIEGKLRLSHLLVGHNEHRILPTRLTTLLIFICTGTWNNLIEARLNIPLSALTPMILIWLLWKEGQIFGSKWLVIVIILAGASLPFSWENILIGFQSQFYFLSLFTLSALALAVYRPDQPAAMFLILFFCVLSILTTASGLLTSMAVAVVYLLGSFIRARFSSKSFLMVITLLTMSLIAYFTMPVVDGHYLLHAETLWEFIKSAIRIMGWPLRGSQLHIGLMWLPSLIAIPLLILRRQIVRIDLLMIGCFVWTGMQIAALAYGRGHEILHMPSRYSEVLLFGLAGNSWFIIRLPDTFGKTKRIRKLLVVLGAAFYSATFIGFMQRTKGDFKTLKEERERRITQTSNVCQYLASNNFTLLNKTGFQLPYPNPTKLQQILDDPQLQKVLNLDDCLKKSRLVQTLR